MKNLFFLILSLNFLYANNFYYEFDKKIEVTEIKESSDLEGVKEYLTNDGRTVKFANEILVQCKQNAYCNDDFEDLTLTNIEQIDSTFFLIKLDDSQNIFEYCEKLHQKDDIQSAHPNFINQRKKR